MDVPDVDALFAALHSPQAADAMKSDGVHGDTIVLLVESYRHAPNTRLYARRSQS
jgi:hypothetical protein